MKIDRHCFDIIRKYIYGEMSYVEAQKQMDEHGDFILADLLANGFTVDMPVDFNSFKGVVGSHGVS